MKTRNKRIKEGIERANREIADGVIYEAALQRELAARKAKAARRWAWVWFVACVFVATHLLSSDGLPWWRVFGGGFVVAMAGWAIHKTDKPKGGGS